MDPSAILAAAESEDRRPFRTTFALAFRGKPPPITAVVWAIADVCDRVLDAPIARSLHHTTHTMEGTFRSVAVNARGQGLVLRWGEQRGEDAGERSVREVEISTVGLAGLQVGKLVFTVPYDPFDADPTPFDGHAVLALRSDRPFADQERFWSALGERFAALGWVDVTLDERPDVLLTAIDRAGDRERLGAFADRVIERRARADAEVRETLVRRVRAGGASDLDLSEARGLELDAALSLAAEPALVGRVALNNNGLAKLPRALARFTRLADLSAWQNRLTRLDDVLFELRELRVLTLSYNAIRELPDDMSGLAGLVSLSLAHNAIRELPDAIGDLASLVVLDLEGNALRELPRALARLGRLRVLRVGENPLDPAERARVAAAMPWCTVT